MATNRREVTLEVGVKTSGEAGLRTLADDVRNVGTAAGASAPGVDTLARELEALTAATKAKRDAERSARTEETAARAELDARRDALARLRAAADATTRSTIEHQDAVRAERLAIIDAAVALRERRTALTAAATAAKEAATAERAHAEQLAAAMGAQVTGNGAVGASIDGLRGQLALLRSVATAAVGGTLVGGLARDLAATADAYNNLGARIKLATGDGQAFGDALAGVQGIAQRTGSSLESTGTLFTRIVTAGKEFNLTQRDALALTETIGQAVQLSGVSAQSSEAALTQLVQGLQSGVLRGDEFNSVMEQSPRLAQALAAGLNVTVGELRKLAEQGALTSQAVIGALQGQSTKLQEEFHKMPPTVERAIARLSAAWEIYVGHADGATGATGTAARAIEALAGNLDLLGNVLLGLGKAAAVYQVVRLAAGYFTATAAATAVATTATIAHTDALVANAAAATTATAGAGRLAGALGAIKGFALVAVLTNLDSLGKAIGEGAAKLMGYGKVMEDAQRTSDALAEATRRTAAEKAALAQATQQATDKALGLNKAARELVSEFDGVILKTGDTKEAIEKLGKALRLDDLAGIRAAGAALDALGQRGKLSADQIKQAMGDALKATDLLVFETQARAAFDNSAQGARRLQAAIDAIADESLRRAGTSAQELQTGFSQAANSAINDVDTLTKTLRNMGTTGDDAGRVLGTALDKALAAANTERAVRAVLERMEDLGKTGLLAGDRLADGLEKGRRKLEELQGGINSVAEAARKLGVQTVSEAKRTAEEFTDAWGKMRDSTEVALQEKIKGFARYRDAAIAANGGVESSEVALQRQTLEVTAKTQGLGDAFEKAMGRADKGLSGTGRMVNALGEQVNAAGERVNQLAAGFDNVATKARNAATAAASAYSGGASGYDSQGFAKNTEGKTLTAAGKLAPPDDSGNWEFISEARPNVAAQRAASTNLTRQGGYWQLTDAAALKQQGAGLVSAAEQRAKFEGAASSSAGTPFVGGNTTHTVNVSINGANTTVGAATADDAARIASLIQQLADASTRAA